MESFIFYLYGAIFIVTGYFVLIFIFDLLLRGFSPFIPSRPWVVEQLMPEIILPTNKPIKLVAFSSGRSGFFKTLGEKYPNAELIGYENAVFPYLVAKTQAFLRRSRIQIRYSVIHRMDVHDADFIYCHLRPDKMRGLGKKLKFECKTGTIVISTGFVIPYLESNRIIELPDKEGRFAFLSKNQDLFQKKNKKFKKEKKAFFYEI
ncbi:hypothetical protein C0583_04765 [Candidatus Parcubacteria bacterium]|nr:MAG: hypothetical protein C0583_04765 [Candidatus Parcubacteria bacterium]